MTAITTSGRPGIGVASIVRAIRVLEVFADRPEGVALTRLSAELGYGKATLSKVLATMERGRFVRRDAVTGHFHLSCRLLALAFAYAERVGIPGLCAPILQALADETGELVQLAVDEELVAGGRAVAVPVIRGDGVVGSVAVSGPTFRVPVHKLHRMAPQLKRAAVELAAVWPHEVTARDFGLGVRVRRDNDRPRAPRRHA